MTSRISPLFALASCAVALGALGSPLAARDTVMPISEVRPGMVGVGRTVFRGATIEEFTVRIIGTLKSVVAPQRDLVLAKLEGGPLADTGVIAGMSGSPVYIDGKLLGAVSYQLGQFPKEPIAGITPIGEMTDATALTTARALRPVAISLARPVPASELLTLWRTDLGAARPFGAAAADVIASLVSADLPRPVSTDLRPISVPLVVGGFEAGMLDRLVPSLAGAGFVATQAAQSAVTFPLTPATSLAPGDAIGVALMSGDFSMGATGTVTQVDGDRVYAFGHPLYNLGPTLFPMTRANVIAVLPSLVTSSKLASLGAVVGTISQDRATAIAGRLGPAPALVPVKVTLTSGRGPVRTFSFGVVNDQLFTPLLTYLAVANVLTSYERQTGAATYVVRGDARIAGQPPIRFDDVFVGDQGAANASAYVAGPLTALYRNATEPFVVDGITLTIEADEQTRTAEIERVWLDDVRVRPGRPAQVHVQLRTFRGETQVLDRAIDIPANATGTMQLLVSDGTRLEQQEARDARRGDLQSVGQIVRAANRSRSAHRIYVRLSTAAPGAVIAGERMPGLPASVAAVIDADRPTGGSTSLRSVARGDWELSVPFAVSGSRQITLTVDPS
ncbi:MAG TPA: SpoIVB peptidase S55 domain-containing protein [Vicinamibacterales bacterium]|nr:SpoIVB peptidase S55 domain-containing protein [Vicinamibacterales bacterium]